MPLERQQQASIGEFPTIAECSQAHTLNEKQHAAFCLIALFFLNSLEAQMGRNKLIDPLRAYIGGEAGTGKSRIINAVLDFAKAWGKYNPIKTIAPTGIAAIQVRGRTARSFFNIRKNGSNSRKITDRDREIFAQVTIILWDEISITSKRQFARAIRYLRKVCDTKPGERCRIGLVLFGDYFQLPPVLGSYLFEPPVEVIDQNENNYSSVKEEEYAGYMYWLDFKDAILLDQNMRRSEDPEYGQLLRRLRFESCTKDDAMLLNSRTWDANDLFSNISKEMMQSISYEREIVASVNSNQNRHALNWICLCHLSKSGNISLPILCVAKFNSTKKSRFPTSEEMNELMRLGDEKTERLPIIQVISIGAPIMISQNLAVDSGIANGTMGKIVGCQFKTAIKFKKIDVRGCEMLLASDLPTAVYVEIPSLSLKERLSSVPSKFKKETIPILPVTEDVSIHLPNRNFSLSITQLPYSIAYAVTTYKLQGRNLDAL